MTILNMTMPKRSLATVITAAALLASPLAYADDAPDSAPAQAEQLQSVSASNAAAGIECKIDLWNPYNDSQGAKARGRVRCNAEMRNIDVRFYIDKIDTDTLDWSSPIDQLFNFNDVSDTGVINYGDPFSQYCSGDYEYEYRARAFAWFEGPNGERWEAEWQTGWIFLNC